MDRSKYIGGSDAAAILGLSPYVTQAEAILRKQGRLDPQEATDAMYFGTVLEPIVIAEYEKRSGKVVLSKGDNQLFLSCDKFDFLACHPDGYTEDGILIEAKTVGQWSIGQWAEGVPEYYIIQGMHNAFVFNSKATTLNLPTITKIAYPVLMAGQEYNLFEVDYDAELAEMIIRQEVTIWNDIIITGALPDISGMPSALVSRLYPPKTETLTIAEGEAAGKALAAFYQIKNRIKELEEELDQKKALVLDAMKGGNRAVYIATDGAFTCSNSITKGRTSLDQKALEAAHPDIYKQFLKQGDPYPVFKVTFKSMAEIETAKTNKQLKAA